jgi:hypothetical protein
MTETFKYGPGQYTMTINVSAGTYNEAVSTATYAGPSIIINGAGSTQTFVTGANNSNTFIAQSGNYVTVQNLDVTTGTGIGPPVGFSAFSGATLNTLNTASGSCASGVWEGYSGGTVWINGNHTFRAGSTMLIAIAAAFGGATNLAAGINLTMAGALTTSSGFALTNANGVIIVNSQGAGYPTFTNPGNVTGPKYFCSLNGVIYTAGASTSYFPGSTAGSLATGGQYG